MLEKLNYFHAIYLMTNLMTNAWSSTDIRAAYTKSHLILLRN